MKQVFDVLFLFDDKNTQVSTIKIICRIVSGIKKCEKNYKQYIKSFYYTHPSVIVLENVDAVKKRPWY